MAETLISPGVLARENDQSQITQGPREFGAAIIGPAVRGPIEVPTEVTSYSEYLAIFGGSVTSGSQNYSYLNQVAANNYFRQGGKSFLVTRVVSSSDVWSSATSKTIRAHDESGVIGAITSSTATFTVVGSFNITGSAAGQVTNATQASTSGTGTGFQFNFKLADVNSSESIAGGTYAVGTSGGSGYKVNDTITFTSASLGATKSGGTDLTLRLNANNILNDECFTLSTISEGTIMNSSGSEGSGNALVSGSSDNLRWEITNSNTSSGVFSLVIRRGDDTLNQKSVLETYSNVSLDPLAPNYIEAVIGNTFYSSINNDNGDYYLKENGNYTNKSRYVYVSAVGKPTPNFFDNNGSAKTEFTGSLPIVSSGSFGGGAGNNFTGSAAKFNEDINASNVQGVIANDYTASINLLSNKDNYKFNVLAAPGLVHQLHPSQVNLLVTTAETRKDCIAVIDLRAYNSTSGNVINQASTFDSSYAATYWPWLQSIDADTGRYVWSPASTFIPGVYAFTDESSDPWFAPAGLQRGGLGMVIKAERKLTSGTRDSLYEANVNPIATFPQSGVVVFGQKTLQKKSTALDRVNVRRLLIALKSFITQVADNLVFEQNTIATRNDFLSQVNPYLESVQQRQGLFAFKVVMDDSNNTPDVIDRNELIGQIFLQPTRTAEFIILDFNVLPTGATFPA
jgi:hypothetical protein